MFIVPKKYRLCEVEGENLYLKLVEQLNKDFNLANEAVDFPMSTTAAELKFNCMKKSTAHSIQVC
jgi:hypothetical protein